MNSTLIELYNAAVIAQVETTVVKKLLAFFNNSNLHSNNLIKLNIWVDKCTKHYLFKNERFLMS